VLPTSSFAGIHFFRLVMPAVLDLWSYGNRFHSARGAAVAKERYSRGSARAFVFWAKVNYR